MSIQLWKSSFLQCCFKMNCSIRVLKFLSTSTKFYTKKQYRMKNKFTFRDDLKKVGLEHSENEIYATELLSEQNNDSNSNPAFISGDLMSQDKNKTHKKFTLHPKTKGRKPALSYQGEILFGVHPVHLALLQKKRKFYHLYVHENVDSSEDDVSQRKEIIKLARILNVPLSFIDNKGLKILAPGAVHQGVCLDAGFLPLRLWNEDQYNMKTSENRPLWVVLHEILDPMNVGAIIRSAYYFGVNRLFTIRGNSCKLSPIVSKASSGVLEAIDIYQIGNLEEFIMKRKEDGWSVVSTVACSSKDSEMTKPVNANQFTISKPTILILGNEGKGISENILKLCDSLISIQPGQLLPKGIDSLNVSVAAGIILYALSNSIDKR